MMTRVEDNETKIEGRAKCICEICKQVGWSSSRTCIHECNYNCDQLIQKFVDHDKGWMTKSKDLGNGNRGWYIKIAGVEVPEPVLNKYTDYLLDRQAEMGLASCEIEKEMYTGRLENVRASLHMAILQSVGWQMMDMSRGARIFVKVLEKYVEKKAKYTKFKNGPFKDWNIDQYHWMNKRSKENGGCGLLSWNTSETE